MEPYTLFSDFVTFNIPNISSWTRGLSIKLPLNFFYFFEQQFAEDHLVRNILRTAILFTGFDNSTISSENFSVIQIVAFQ